MDPSSAPKSGNRLRGSHGTSTPNRSDDVLAEGPALLTSEALANRVVNKQKQSLVWPARDRGQASINKLTFDKKCKMSVCYSSSNARCAVYNSVMVCIINMIEVINGENVIYACGHPSGRTRQSPRAPQNEGRNLLLVLQFSKLRPHREEPGPVRDQASRRMAAQEKSRMESMGK
jgi:hypothetical protein